MLDTDNSGFISMLEFDRPSAEILGSFKEWVEQHFGSVERAFRVLDSDGSGTVSFSELRCVCKKLRWNGSFRLLFDSLDSGAKERDQHGELTRKRVLRFAEVRFLDTWNMEPAMTEAIGVRPAIFQDVDFPTGVPLARGSLQTTSLPSIGSSAVTRLTRTSVGSESACNGGVSTGGSPLLPQVTDAAVGQSQAGACSRPPRRGQSLPAFPRLLPPKPPQSVSAPFGKGSQRLQLCALPPSRDDRRRQRRSRNGSSQKLRKDKSTVASANTSCED